MSRDFTSDYPASGTDYGFSSNGYNQGAQSDPYRAQSAGEQDSYAAGGGYEDRGGESRGRGRGGGRGGMGGRGGTRGGGSGGPGSRDAYVHK